MKNIATVNHSEYRMPKSFIIKWIAETYKELDRINQKRLHLDKLELVIVFLEPSASQKINYQFRRKKKPTDVLSFQGDRLTSFGELLLCPEILDRQAKEHGLSFKHELGYMLLHGVLHLMGFEHEKDSKDAQLMFRLQDHLFDRLCKRL